MWPFGTPASVYVGMRRAVVQVRGLPRIDVGGQANAGMADAFDVIDQLERDWPPQAGRVRAQVLLSGGLARPFVLDAMEGVSTRADALAVAKGLAPEATGLQSPCAVWLAAWTPGQACMAAAVEQALLDRLMAFAAHGRIHLKRVAPWWTLAIDQASRRADPPQLIGLHDDDAFSVIGDAAAAQPGAFTFCPAPTPQRCAASIGRVAMTLDTDAAKVAHAHWTLSADGDGELASVRWEAVTP